MLLRVDMAGPLPVYAQIVAQIRSAIASGVVRPGEFLPSLRDAAKSLRINPHTVAKAYRELEAEGLVRTDQGRGTQVVGDVGRLSDAHRRERLARLAEQLVVEGYLLGATAEQIAKAVDAELNERLSSFRDRSGDRRERRR
jgi:GntR family transcriptional regulator